MSETSTAQAFRRGVEPSCFIRSLALSSLRSRMAMYAPLLWSSSTVAAPRPDALSRIVLAT